MANIPLKSIKFPGLAGTYTVPSNAGELPYDKSDTYPADTVGKALQNIGDSSAPAIIETATGSIASFTDGANVPVKDLVAEIVPLQSGSGDPSPDNVRPITGWTECNVVVSPTEDAQDGETHTISFASAGTVYGGRLDVTSGVLTVDKIGIELDGSPDENWGLSSSPANNMYYINVNNIINSYDLVGIICNRLTEIKAAEAYDKNNVTGVGAWGSGDSTLRVCLDISIVNRSVADFKTWLSNNPLFVVYPVATEVTYQLTPTEVKTLLKNNNIWADTGDVTVEYVADTKTFIENLVNA